MPPAPESGRQTPRPTDAARIAELEARVDWLENSLVEVSVWAVHEVCDITAAGHDLWAEDPAIRVKFNRRSREAWTPHRYVPDERNGMTNDVNQCLRMISAQIGEVLIVFASAFHPRRGLTRLLSDLQVIGRLLKEARVQGHKAEQILAAMDSKLPAEKPVLR